VQTAEAPGAAGTSEFDDVWVVIPVYNEGSVIAEVVEGLLPTFPNVVCVDDGSRDDSADRIFPTAAHLVRHPVNLGQGAALQTGLQYALLQDGSEYFVTFDADGQHQVEDAAELVRAVRNGGADVALGSRFLSGTVQVPWIKRAMLKTVAALSPAARRLQLTDAHNGLRVLNRAAASQLKITMNGMAHASEIVTYLARSELEVTEVPVTVLYTDYSKAKGQSLINGVNILFDLSLRSRRTP
jgi:glycosyltransferase involved in cell wall biosynthesis